MLRDLQKEFLHSFYSKDFNYFSNHLSATKNLTSCQRCTIYQESITEGLIKSLRESFPVTEKLVGMNFFRHMAYCYIMRKKSISPNISDFGKKFPEFVKTFPPVSCVPYLTDISYLEWCWQEVYNGLNYQALDVNAFSQLTQEEQFLISLLRPENSFLIYSSFPIKKIWEINQAEEGNEIFDMKLSADWLLIWRPQMGVIIDELTSTQFNILKGFDEGLTITQLIDKLQNEKIDPLIEIPQMMAKGWFSRFAIF